MSNSNMHYRPLGRTGVQVSALSLGGWTTYGHSVQDANVVRSILQTAFDAGINFFDIADMYGRGETERSMGAVLRDFPRHELLISSKVFFPMSDDVNDRGLSRKHIMESVDKSLQRLGTDYLDIYFCHRFDEQTPVEETARAMDDLVHQGKILYWGTSEWSGDQLREVHNLCEKYNLYKPHVEQPQYNMLHRRVENELHPIVDETGMGLVIWSPLASGMLTGKYDDGIPTGARLESLGWLRDALYNDRIRDRVRTVRNIAQDLNCSRAQLALAWTLANTRVSSVITGATNVDQCLENLGALKVTLSEDVVQTLNEIFSLPED